MTTKFIGEAIRDNADIDPDPFDTTAKVNPLKIYLTPLAAGIIVVSTCSGLSAEECDQLMDLPDVDTNAGAVRDHATAINLLIDVLFVKNIEGGHWVIENNQMIFCGEDDSTEFARFNLFDARSNPAMTNVMQRVRV